MHITISWQGKPFLFYNFGDNPRFIENARTKWPFYRGEAPEIPAGQQADISPCARCLSVPAGRLKDEGPSPRPVGDPAHREYRDDGPDSHAPGAEGIGCRAVFIPGHLLRQHRYQHQGQESEPVFCGIQPGQVRD